MSAFLQLFPLPPIGSSRCLGELEMLDPKACTVLGLEYTMVVLCLTHALGPPVVTCVEVATFLDEHVAVASRQLMLLKVARCLDKDVVAVQQQLKVCKVARRLDENVEAEQ